MGCWNQTCAISQIAIFQRELWDREDKMPREVVEYFKERIKDIQCGTTGVKQ